MLCSQDVIQEIKGVQEEIDKLQTSFTEDLAYDAVDSDMVDQLAMQSSLAVLAERMATIHMKALGKQQLLEVRLTSEKAYSSHEYRSSKICVLYPFDYQTSVLVS